jgi:hypothetical protein
VTPVRAAWRVLRGRDVIWPGPDVLHEPRTPGLIRYRIELLPHFAANNGEAWESGTNTPAEVARCLRGYAEQAEQWASMEAAPADYYVDAGGAS